jgi:excisionase family DNA binding protein
MITTPSTIDPERAYTVPEAAAILRLSPATVRRLIAADAMGGYRAGHALRTMGADIIAFRAGGGVAAGVHARPAPEVRRRGHRAPSPRSAPEATS